MLAGNKSKNSQAKLHWTPEAEQAFIDSKDALSETTLLHYPARDVESSIAVDASDIAVGGVLQQRHEGSWKPISFFSCKLNKAQRSYSTFSKELLGAYMSVKHFRHYVEGTNFHILTDHQPLVRAIAKKSPRDLPREERWLEYIAIFTTDIRHIKGTHNVVADAISRHQEDEVEQEAENNNSDNLAISAIFTHHLADELVTAQQNDQELREILAGRKKCTPHLHKVGDIYCQTVNGINRNYIPGPLRRTLFDEYHNLAHPGIRGSRKYLATKYFWSGLYQTIKDTNIYSL